MIPFSKAGKSLEQELTKLYQVFSNHSALYLIALMACSVMQPLLCRNLIDRVKLKITPSALVDYYICGVRAVLLIY